MKSKFGKYIGLAFCIIVFLFAMVWLLKISAGYLFYEKTNAVITDVRYEYNGTARGFIRNKTKLKLSYTVSGESYGAELTESGKTAYQKGETKTVYYNPKHPEKAFAQLSGKGLVTPLIVILGSAYGIFAGFLNIKRAKDTAQKRKEFFESDTDT